MKHILKIILVLLPVFCFAQVKGTFTGKISKSKLIHDSLITNIIKDIPVDCKVTGYHYSVRTNNKQFKIKCVGNELRQEVQGTFKKANKGDTLIFDKLETACLAKHKKKYRFIIGD